MIERFHIICWKERPLAELGRSSIPTFFSPLWSIHCGSAGSVLLFSIVLL